MTPAGPQLQAARSRVEEQAAIHLIACRYRRQGLVCSACRQALAALTSAAGRGAGEAR